MEEGTVKLDVETFKEILNLQEKVTLYEKALGEMFVILHQKKSFFIIQYEDDLLYVNEVFNKILELYPLE